MTTAEAAPKTLQEELQSPEKGGIRQQVGGGGRHSVAPVEARVVSLEHPLTTPQHSSPLHSPPLEPGSPAITHLLFPTQFRPAHPRGLDTPKLGRPQRGPPHSLTRPAATFFFLFFFFFLFLPVLFCTLGAARRG